MKWDIRRWGDAWYGPNAITNIFSFPEMANRYQITTDSSVDKAFIVHMPEKKVHFELDENKLYVYFPKQLQKLSIFIKP